MGSVVGKGAGGTVYEGRWRGTPVAIKRVDVENEESTKAYLIEVNFHRIFLEILFEFSRKFRLIGDRSPS